MKFRSTRWVLLSLALVLVLGAPLLSAQEPSETDELQMLRASAESDRQGVVALNLGLTDDEGKAFWPLYREYRLEQSKVGDRLQALIQDFANVYDNLSDEKATPMLDEHLSIQAAEIQVKKEYVEKFREILPAAKVTRFYQIENKLDTIIRMGLVEGIPLVTPAAE
ncbi:MAG: hypothetical protein GY906_34335 [bacterium]|nr:hypothetical protein [bacterium]